MLRTALYSILLAALASFAAADGIPCSASTSPTWKETIGNVESYPYLPEAITIVNQNDSNVVFEVQQLWVETGTPMFAVHYRSADEGEEICDMDASDNNLIPWKTPKQYTAECAHGWADVSIYVYVGDMEDFSVDECEACQAPDFNYVGYYVAVPCEYRPECEPSAAPSGLPSASPTGIPTGTPTGVPTGVPTGTPTGGPTGSPTTAAPTEGEDLVIPPVPCAESAKAKLKSVVGNDSAYPDALPPITILTQDIDSVTIEVEQTFDTNNVGMMAVGFRNPETTDAVCEMNHPVEFGFESTITAECNHGYAEINLFVYTGDDFDVEDCEACTIPDEVDYVAYAYLVPCIPVCKPEIPDCLEGPLVTLADIGSEADICVYADTPVMVKADDMKDDSVDFVVENTWTTSVSGGEITSASVSYTNDAGEEVCEVYDADEVFNGSRPLTASCDHGMATVVVTVHSDDISHVADEIPNACTTPSDKGSCAYEVVIACMPEVVCGSTGSPTEDPTASPTSGPTSSPTSGPTSGPTSSPTSSPTSGPTDSPSDSPTSAAPTWGPTTPLPTQVPTGFPSLSSPPTGCFKPSPPIIADEICYEIGGEKMEPPIDLPPDAIIINAQSDDELSFEISQEWAQEVTGIAVRSGLDSCEVRDGVDAGEIFGSYEGDCVGGIAAVTVVVYLDGSFVAEECDACNAEELIDMGGDKKFCAYRLEIPCEAIPVDCGEPSASPSGSYFPSSIPSESPTKSAQPSSSPTSSPTSNPTGTPTVSPTSEPTSSPTNSPTDSPTAGPTATPTANPTSGPTNSPTDSPTGGPTAEPTSSPTSGPTAGPTSSPTSGPTAGPTSSPTSGPTDGPTSSPTDGPTGGPTSSPTDAPTGGPTTTPTAGPTSSPTSNPTDSPTSSPSDSPSGSYFPSSQPTDAPTRSPAPSDSPTSTPTTSPTSGPTDSPTSGPTNSPTDSPTSVPTASPTSGPTSSPTDGPTSGPTSSPTNSPTGGPTASPTDSPTSGPTSSPTDAPTGGPTATPTSSPTGGPTASPTDSPTSGPTSNPTDAPTGGPTASPTDSPTGGPTAGPTAGPTTSPTSNPTDSPTSSPSDSPSGSYFPSSQPTGVPTRSPAPSDSPTSTPTTSPTSGPTDSPTSGPTNSPTESPTSGPTSSPTDGPTSGPTSSPTNSPTGGPTASPTDSPTGGPTSSPTDAPTGGPTATPTSSPTGGPTSSPTNSPTGGPTSSPTDAPTGGPTASPTDSPTGGPTASPTAGPTTSPTSNPTQSMEPTACTEPMPPNVIDAVCMTTGGEKMETTPLPPGAITTTNIMDGSIDVAISQLWGDEAGIAIQAGMDNCIIKGDLPNGFTEDISATCTDGYAAATVVVYLDEDFEPEECDACNVDELALMGGNNTFCAYRVEIPCESIAVDCGEPSAAPSGSYYPSTAPSAAPTKSAQPSSAPTGTPTAGPTANPTTSPTSVPTSSPTSQPTSSPTASPSSSPTSGPTSSPTSTPTSSPTSTPTDVPTASPTTKAPTDSPTTKAPSAAPTKACPLSDAILVSNEGDTLYPDIPIEITHQNTTHVGFTVKNTFTRTISSVFTQYHSGSFGETECLSEDNVETVMDTDFTAKCMKNTKISIVNVWITDCEVTNTFLDVGDNAEIPECCHPGEVCKTVQYTFKLPCVNPCPEDGVAVAEEAPGRRNLSSIIRERKAHEGSTKEFEDEVGRAETNDSDDHFCVVEDYPCGVHNDKVHVCHYSARDGYKTFCVPEADSDALRFYPKDYCGPCVGGYASQA